MNQRVYPNFTQLGTPPRPNKTSLLTTKKLFPRQEQKSPGHLVAWQWRQISSEPLLECEDQYHQRPEQSWVEHEILNAPD